MQNIHFIIYCLLIGEIPTKGKVDKRAKTQGKIEKRKRTNTANYKKNRLAFPMAVPRK